MKKITEISKIKKGGYIIDNDEAYKVINIQHSKAGKHGHGKYRVDAVSVIGGKKISIVKGSGHKVEVPIIEKHNAQVLTVEERVKQQGSETIVTKIANVMDSDSYETFDLEVPKELEADVKDGVKILYWEVLGSRIMKQVLA